jgi:hypothetical protein
VAKLFYPVSITWMYWERSDLALQVSGDVYELITDFLELFLLLMLFNLTLLDLL